VPVTAPPKPATLRARLHTPRGEAPFPALVFLHGCGGLGRRQDAWADELSREGYVVLVPSRSIRGAPTLAAGRTGRPC